jgi:alpha-glucosidase/oligosaccharide 4-alpha-D-glucosyltransferase
MKSRLTCIIVLFISITSVIAQNSQRTYVEYKEYKSHLEVVTSDGTYLIKPYTDKIVETSFIPTGEEFNPNSHAVVLLPKEIEINLVKKENVIEYNTPGIKVIITIEPFNISYGYKNKKIISEKGGYAKTNEYESLNFELDSTEKIFGGGARVLGMNRRGNRLQLYNRAHYGYTTHSELMNFTMPLVVSSKMYTIHFDNAPIGYLDLDSKKNNTLTYETISGRKIYQIIVGDSWEDLIDQYTDLTGKQPLPPRWAFGNFSSRFGYHSEKETRETVNKFIEDSIPLEAVIIDIYWFGTDIFGHMGNLEFLKDSFPTPKKMIDDFASKGVKTILVTEPFILTTSKRWNEVVEKKLVATDTLGNPFTYDFYFGNTGLLDIYKPEAKDWFWNIYKKYTNMGIGGWWGDLGEPEVHPSEVQHVVGSADEVHNIYGHDWTRLIFEGYKKNFPNQRPFILMRAGYSGSQHYGIIPWTGDVSRSWGGLQPQVEISLQMGLQGIGYMHSDLGGFAGGDVFDPELYTRWLQYGVFQPVYRPHAQEHIPSEPVFHDEKTKALAKESIEMRYRLLPYIYTIAFDNSQSGIPLMRPLFFMEPENDRLLEVSDSYLWGDNFLVSPVTEAGIKQKDVYMPANANWFDFYTDKAYRGGFGYKVNITEDHIPLFVKGGSFIPMIKPLQSTDLYTTKNLEIHYYPDPTATENTGKLYDDDGITPNTYEEGKYEILYFKGTYLNDKLSITFKSEKGPHYESIDRKISLVIHKFDEEPEQVFVDENVVSYQFNKEKNLLTISFDWNKESNPVVEIKLKERKILL